MNKAVFLFTVRRLFRPQSLLMLLFFGVGLPTLLAWMVNQAHGLETVIDNLTPLFTGPTLCMVVAWIFVANSVGNAKSLKDGEYMALLFTRPIGRASYAFSKWLAGSLLVFILITFQMFYLCLVVHLMGRGSICSVEWLDVLNVLLNALGCTALVVMIHSFPARVGVFLFAALVYISMLGPLLFGYSFKENGPQESLFVNFIRQSLETLGSFLFAPFDINPYFNTIKIFWLPLLAYASNIALYLWIAIAVLNRREFFYANE